jgi:GMP synthase-like glutamine amidotransferase
MTVQVARRITRRATAHVLILQHDDAAPAGALLDALDDRNLAATTVRGERLPDPRGWAFVVSLGSTAPAYSDDGWAADERAWLRRADAAGVPILGLGFGAQALALALGGDVERAAQSEHGMIYVSTNDSDLIPAGPWIAWHDDVIVLPPEAELLAHNDSGPQAFRVSRHVGVQFHPEVTPAIAGRWVLQHDGGALDSQGLLEGLARETQATRANAKQLFSAFIDQALGATAPRAELASIG